MNDPSDDHPGWERCTAEGAELDGLRRGLQTSLREKIQWLEQAELLAIRMRENRRPQPDAIQTGESDQTSVPGNKD